MTALLIAGRLTPTNVALHDACVSTGVRARLLPPQLAVLRVQPDEFVLGRVDVAPTVDGVEPGLAELAALEEDGMIVLNDASALAAAHDKLATAQALAAAGLPHPWTVHVAPGERSLPDLPGPYVVKPRFGSWGKDVVRCSSGAELQRTMSALSGRGWFERQGVLVQELLPGPGFDLRLVVSGGSVVGAISRVAAPGEWRTNVALGGRRRRVVPNAEAESLAVAAVAAVGGELMGVDLLPTSTGYVVLEVNGCVDFTPEYSLGQDVFRRAVLALLFPGLARLHRPAGRAEEPLPEPF
jgi:RimK family alpha-L-glutamate ligase